LWERMAEPGRTGWDVGRERARREQGAFSYRNAITLRVGDDPAGAVMSCLIGYGIPEEPGPVDSDMPAMFVPLQELENLAPGTWYVNVLATFPGHRGRGHGSRLLEFAEARSRAGGLRGTSIIVEDANTGRGGFTSGTAIARSRDGGSSRRTGPARAPIGYCS